MNRYTNKPYPAEAPQIGDRIYYKNSILGYEVTGVVTKIYPISLHVAVKIDNKPDNWPYPGNDKFAPAITEVEIIERCEK